MPGSPGRTRPGLERDPRLRPGVGRPGRAPSSGQHSPSPGRPPSFVPLNQGATPPGLATVVSESRGDPGPVRPSPGGAGEGRLRPNIEIKPVFQGNHISCLARINRQGSQGTDCLLRPCDCEACHGGATCTPAPRPEPDSAEARLVASLTSRRAICAEPAGEKPAPKPRRPTWGPHRKHAHGPRLCRGRPGHAALEGTRNQHLQRSSGGRSKVFAHFPAGPLRASPPRRLSRTPRNLPVTQMRS